MNNYRQSTAKALGLKLSPHHTDLYWLSNTSTTSPNYTRWQPDKDANHRDMVWEWMKEQGQQNSMDFIFDKWWDNEESLFTATEKAWEEYTNNK